MHPNQERYNQEQQRLAATRAQRAIKLRAAGETWTVIGQILGVSRQRAQQLAAREQKRNGSGK